MSIKLVYEHYHRELNQTAFKSINCVHGAGILRFLVTNLPHDSGLTLKMRMSFQAPKKT